MTNLSTTYPEDELMKLKCGHCGYEWDYNGTKKFYATCPDCHYKVKIEGAKTEKKSK